MEFIQIDGCRKPVSRLMKGTDYFYHNDYELAKTNLDAFIAIGGNSLDTANVYCSGQSEEVIGRYLEEKGNRDQLVILTKGAHHDQNGPRLRKEDIAKDLSLSFERLRTNYIDLYALHRDDPNTPVEHIIDALNEYIAAGTVHAIGTSNWSWQRIQEANDYAKRAGLTGFTFNSPNLSLAKTNEPFWKDCVSADEEYCQWHEKAQMPLLSWSSQARGFFTGLFSPENRENEDLVRVFYNDGNWERLRRATQLGEQKGLTAIQIALAYVMNQPFPTCALIGARSEAELTSCNEGSVVKLTKAEMDWLDLVAENLE